MPELPDRKSAFFEWFSAALEQAGITDLRYPVKGLNVWPPYGFLARRLLDRSLREAVEPLGYQEVSFPALIPETELAKEREHIKGFESQVYWVTHGGTTPLDVRLCLRPTSETAMYPIFALWVRSHRDLPLRVYQVVNVFRYETKTTRPLLRVREIHFFEGHTVQIDEAGADRQVADDLRSFARIAEGAALPYLSVRRPDWDKFPGAHYSIAFDVPFGEGRTLQVGTVHHYRDNFARPYGISFEREDGSRAFAHQTTYGISERLLGAILGGHGDEKGLIFPPPLAPVQVVIVPIPGKEGRESVEAFASTLAEELERSGLRVRADLGPDRPGAKFFTWEARGVPLRLEVGGREVASGTISMTDRLGHRGKIARSELAEGVARALEGFHERLRLRAEEAFHSLLKVAGQMDDLAHPGRVYLVGWCGKEECGHRIEEKVDGGLLGTLVGELPKPLPRGEGPPHCIACGQSPSVWAAAGRPL
jgi:prolyl-tRNA synthetase